MRLFISNKGELIVIKTTPRMELVKKLLDRSKDGEIFTTTQLAGVAKINVSDLRSNFAEIESYTYRIGTKRYWGKPNTIKQLKKEVKSWK